MYWELLLAKAPFPPKIINYFKILHFWPIKVKKYRFWAISFPNFTFFDQDFLKKSKNWIFY